MRQNKKIVIGTFALLLALLCAFLLSLPTMTGCMTVSFPSRYGSKDVTLIGTYKSVKGSDYAALICPGYSCDRQKWRPMMDMLVSNGISTLSFDYSGQGASYGTIGFDNADSDRIPEQIADGIEALHDLSGVDYDHIILIGHSMGGRSILRLLYDYNCETAETTIEKRPIENVILLAPEVNYEFSAQASLFAGTSDAEREPWKSFNPSYILNTNVYLYGSTADDIVSDGDVLALYNRLGGNAPSSGLYQTTELNEYGDNITVSVLSGVLHSYEMYSPRFVSLINDALTEITEKESSYPAARFRFVYLSWFLGLFGIWLTISGLVNGTARKTADRVPRLTNASRFLRCKALLWIPGLVMSFLICCLCVVMPFGSPVMNIPYMCCIAGYGFVMFFAFRKGTFPGTKGKLPKWHLNDSMDSKTVIVCGALIFAVWYILRATMYRLIPLNARLFWVCLAAVMMTVAYYVSGCENDMLRQAFASGKYSKLQIIAIKLVYNLIQYVPLLLLAAFYAVLKSYSGMIGQVQNMLLMYIFCIPLGDYVKRKTGNRLFGAMLTGFLFQTLMITSAALISFF